MDETNDLSISLGLDPTGLRQGLSEAERTISGAGRRISASIESIGNLGQKLAGLGATLTASLTLPIVGLATASIKAYGDIQALQKGLEAVAGSAQLAQQQFQDMKEVAKLPGLGLQEAVKGTINLQAIGFSASKAKETLLQFGNAVATVGKGRVEFERAIYGISQLANTPFPLGEDLNIVADVLPQVRTLLNDTFGTSRTEELRALGVSSQQLVDTIITGLAKLPRVSGGIKNAFENFGDSMQQTLARIGKVIDDNLNISGIVDKITDALDVAVTAFEGLDPMIQKVILSIAGLVAIAGPLILGLGGIMTALPIVTAGLGALGAGFTFLISPIGLVVAGLVAVVTAIVANWGKIKPYIDSTIERFKRLYENSVIVRTGVQAFGASLEIMARSGFVVLKVFYNNFLDFGKAVLNVFEGIGKAIEGFLTFDYDKIFGGVNMVLAQPYKFINDNVNNSLNGLSEINTIFTTTMDKWKNFDINNFKIPKIFGGELEKEINKAVTKGLGGPKKKDPTLTTEEIKPFKIGDGSFSVDKEYERVYRASADWAIKMSELSRSLILPIKPVKEFNLELQLEAERFRELTENLNKDLESLTSNSISSALSDMFSSIGEAIGSGGNAIQAIGNTLINAFGSFISELGAMLIKYGTLAVMKGTLDEIIKTGGYQAIAAGIAAIAVGAALSVAGGAIGSAAKGGLNGSVSTSTGASASSNYSGNYSSGGFQGGEIKLRLEGRDLVTAFNRNVIEQDRVNAG